MKTTSRKLQVKTKADGGMHDITEETQAIIEEEKISDGIVVLFCIGSTCALSTVEFEPGLSKDVPACLDRIAPKNIEYAHHQTWHDDNGRSHVKATLMGPSLTVPIVGGELTLGTWQQIVLLEWDTRDRTREVVLQFISESR